MTDGTAQEGAPGTPAARAGEDGGAGQSSAPAGALGARLGGDLPCVVCRYNLRGLSIRSVCPECGTAVRATILAMVDPHAAELEPIANPRLTAVGLVAWVFFALFAVLLCWIPAPGGLWYWVWHAAAAGCVACSGLGALALVRPHEGVAKLGTVLAGVGVFLYAPLAWLVWEVSSARVTGGQSAVFPYAAIAAQERIPTLERAMICVTAAVIALLLRPNARLLVARSLALRTGRVDRQTILAIVSAAGIAALGEGAVELSRGTRGTIGDIMRLAGEILIPAGWALVTLGIVGSLVDAVRISRSILIPAPSLRQVIAGKAHTSERSPQSG
jgi:hypothetical protein